jgi:hypothetical protein
MEDTMRRIDLIAGTPYAFRQSRYGTPEQVWVIDIRPAHATYDGPAFCSGGDGVAVMRKVRDYQRDDAGRVVRDGAGQPVVSTTWQPVVVRTRHLISTWEEQELSNARARAAREQREREAAERREQREREAAAEQERFTSTLAQLQAIGVDVDNVHTDYSGRIVLQRSTFDALGEAVARLNLQAAS